jgi:hypothetical protein
MTFVPKDLVPQVESCHGSYSTSILLALSQLLQFQDGTTRVYQSLRFLPLTYIIIVWSDIRPC